MNTFKLRLLSVLILVCLLAVPPGSYARAGGGGITYVDRDAAGLNNGTSWANAYTDLQTALTSPWSSNIWVAEGIYKPTTGTDQSATFQLRGGLYLYGGFAGNETDFLQRNPSAHVTILSGDIGMVSVSTDNSYHVVTANTSGAVGIDGFTITGGYAYVPASDQEGGGLIRRGGITPTMDLKRVTFRKNAASKGGGIYNEDHGLTLDKVVFEDNTATRGGGIYNSGTVMIMDTTFAANHANTAGGGLYSNDTAAIRNSTFYDNQATTMDGGAIFSNTYLIVRYSTFSHNEAGGNGAAIYNTSGEMTLNNSILADSISGVDCYNNGGALMTTDHNLIENNAGGANACGTPLLTGDPRLGPLTNNGGFTQTMALLPGSPAINFANTADCPYPDQRGMPRPLDVHCDIGAYEKEPDTWYIRGQGVYAYGDRTDTPVPADYNGDGMAEMAVFRPSTGTWYIRGVGPIVYGAMGDIPVAADYTGDGLADIAVFRPSTGTWYIRGVGPFVYGAMGDIPAVADYTGDGLADIAVFRPLTSTWYIRGVGSFAYGAVGDIPAVADYTGDGLADIAVFRPSDHTWYIRGVGPIVYGDIEDIPMVGDYTGDGLADIAVFRNSNHTWYIRGVGAIVYGATGDIPVMADYTGDGLADIAVFRPWHYP